MTDYPYIPHPFRKKRNCKTCKKEFITKSVNHFYCSECKKEYFRTGTDGIPSSTVGAISEILVSADLLKKGYEVFRAMSPSCSCDLAVLKDGKLKRIEVRTGKRIRNGKIYASKDGFRADIFATVVHKENIITYEPKL
jgi:hypothetical protein